MSQSPTSVIGHTNGDEGLAQPMLEVTTAFYYSFFFQLFGCGHVSCFTDSCIIDTAAPNQ